MDRLTWLVSRLQRLGYRTQTFGDEFVLELDAHSRVRGSYEQIEGLIPRLTRETAERSRRKAKPQKKLKRSKRRRVKVSLSSANIPAKSVEARPKLTRWHKTRSQGGMPGLGKHH